MLLKINIATQIVTDKTETLCGEGTRVCQYLHYGRCFIFEVKLKENKQLVPIRCRKCLRTTEWRLTIDKIEKA